jgi:hypothetical protein
MIFDVTITDAEGGICTKEMAIAIDANCPDWANDLVWPVTIYSVAGNGIASLTPDNAAGDTFVATLSAGKTPANGANAWAIYAFLTGFSGSACNCNLHFTITKLGSIAGSLAIAHNKSGGFATISTTNWILFANGTYDIPFAVPDSGGVPYDIRIEAAFQAQGVTLANSLAVTGVFSNVP